MVLPAQLQQGPDTALPGDDGAHPVAALVAEEDHSAEGAAEGQEGGGGPQLGQQQLENERRLYVSVFIDS